MSRYIDADELAKAIKICMEEFPRFEDSNYSKGYNDAMLYTIEYLKGMATPNIVNADKVCEYLDFQAELWEIAGEPCAAKWLKVAERVVRHYQEGNDGEAKD